MKLWRGEPDHSYWKALIKPRDRAIGMLAFAGISGYMAVAAYVTPSARCLNGGRLICALARFLTNAIHMPVHVGEAIVWFSFGLVCLMIGVNQWRQQ